MFDYLKIYKMELKLEDIIHKKESKIPQMTAKRKATDTTVL